MAITDTRPETGSDVAPSLVPAPVSILGSGEHTVIGVIYIVTAALFGIAGLVAWALASIHDVSSSFLSDTVAERLGETGALGLVLLVLVPAFLGIGTYIVPLQVGARTVAFPRAAAAALWTWLLSSGVYIVSVAIDGGLGGDRTEAVSLGMLAILGLVAALMIGIVCVVTTAVALRAPGLTLDRVPLTSFAMLVGGSVWLLTLPVLAGNVLLMWVDIRYGDGSLSASDVQFSQVSWILGQPQIYAFVVPGLGIVADAVATLTGARLDKRGVFLTAIGAFAVLGVGAWAQPVFFDGVTDNIVWQAVSLLPVLPVLVLLGGLALALKAGRPQPKGALGLALVSMLLLLLGTVAGALVAITPLELRQSAAAVEGQFVLVLAAGLAAIVAALAYWGPKMTGRRTADAPAKLATPVMLGGGALGGAALVVLGFGNRFTGLADATDALIWVSIVGSLLLALGLVLALLGLLSGVRHSAPEAGADPWGTGQTLEWKYASPPGDHDLGELAVVRSPEPLLDEEA